jgi:hypothetical protein
VNDPRDQLPSRAALADDEHRATARADAPRERQHRSHDRGRAKDAPGNDVRRWRRRRRVGLQLRELARVAECRGERLGGGRTGNDVDGAQAQRFGRCSRTPAIRDAYDRRAPRVLRVPAQEADRVLPRGEVEDDGIGARGDVDGLSRLSGSADGDVVPERFEDRRQLAALRRVGCEKENHS